MEALQEEQDLEGQPEPPGAAAPVQNLPWLPNLCAATAPTAYGWGRTSHTPFSEDKKAPGPGSISFPVYRRVDNLLQRQDSATGWLGTQHLGPECLDSNLRSSTH